MTIVDGGWHFVGEKAGRHFRLFTLLSSSLSARVWTRLVRFGARIIAISVGLWWSSSWGVALLSSLLDLSLLELGLGLGRLACGCHGGVFMAVGSCLRWRLEKQLSKVLWVEELLVKLCIELSVVSLYFTAPITQALDPHTLHLHAPQSIIGLAPDCDCLAWGSSCLSASIFALG